MSWMAWVQVGIGASWCLRCEQTGQVVSTKGAAGAVSWERIVRLATFNETIASSIRRGKLQPLACPDCQGAGSSEVRVLQDMPEDQL